MSSWITDTPTSTRFPLYTRANADEICPRPFTPLTWSLAWERGAVPGTADGWVHLRAFRPEEFRMPVAEVYGCWGGYLYNQVSVGRVFGARAPGTGPDDIDRTYFGSRPDVPPYTPHPDDTDEALSAAAGETLAAALSAQSLPHADELVRRARAWSEATPNLDKLHPAELVARARASCEELRHAWDVYIQVIICASAAPGVVHAIAGQVGRDDDAVAALSAVGDVVSAKVNTDLWALSRIDPVSQEFDEGLADFLAEHGHRGPFEYELASPTWRSEPDLVHLLLDRLRLQGADAAPTVRELMTARMRDAATARLTAAVSADSQTAGTLKAALTSARLHYRQREATKDALLRVNDEVRRPLRELCNRAAAWLERPEDVFQLLDRELDAFAQDPSAWGETLARRADQFHDLGRRRPPYLVRHGDDPDPHSWPFVSDLAQTHTEAHIADLRGIGVSPGTATGHARVVDDLADVEDLASGDVLVCATTDPAWTPLLLTASAVVCEVGAEGSHAAIVARELGIPAVMSVDGARGSIPDGALVRVDGVAGRVVVERVAPVVPT